MPTSRDRRRQKRQSLRAAGPSPAPATLPDDCALTDLQASLTIQAASGDATAAPKTELLAYSGGLLRVEGFPHPVVVDIPTLQASAPQYPLLLNHVATQGVGHTTTIDTKNGREVKASGVLSLDNSHRREVIDGSRNGFKWQPSIHVRIDRSQTRLIPPGQTLQANGRTFTGPVLYTRNSRLKEISFVPLGGDDDATAHLAAKAGSPAMTPELREFITAAGANPDTLNAEQIATWTNLMASAKAAATKAATTTDPAAKPLDEDAVKAAANAALEQRMQPVLDELKRLREERENSQREADLMACATRLKATEFAMTINSKEVNLLAHAKAEKWSADRFELEFLRESRQVAPTGYAHSSAERINRESLAAALLIRSNIPLDTPLFTSNMEARAELMAACGANRGGPHFLTLDTKQDVRHQTADHAWKLRDMSLADIVRACAEIDGHHVGRSISDNLQAALSSHTLSWVFTTNFSASLMRGWEEEIDSTQGWVEENRNVPNFLSHEVGRALGTTSLDKHTKGVQANHATISDTYETLQINRYSKQFVIDEMDVINDRFGSTEQTPPVELGRAARRMRPDMVYAWLMRNKAMRDTVALFHADRDNLRTSSALSDTNLAAAITQFMTQQEGGVNINLAPDTFIGPSALIWTIRKLIESAETTNSSGIKNVLQAALSRIVTDPRLDNGLTDPMDKTIVSGNATSWYLATTRRPALQVGYLRGGSTVPGVTPWRKNGEEGKWELGWAIKHDIGLTATLFQTIQRNNA